MQTHALLPKSHVAHWFTQDFGNITLLENHPYDFICLVINRTKSCSPQNYLPPNINHGCLFCKFDNNLHGVTDAPICLTDYNYAVHIFPSFSFIFYIWCKQPHILLLLTNWIIHKNNLFDLLLNQLLILHLFCDVPSIQDFNLSSKLSCAVVSSTSWSSEPATK